MAVSLTKKGEIAQTLLAKRVKAGKSLGFGKQFEANGTVQAFLHLIQGLHCSGITFRHPPLPAQTGPDVEGDGPLRQINRHGGPT